MPFLDVPGARVWYEAIGSGGPVTVVAHGLSSSSADLVGLAQGLTGTRVIFDFRGHGRSVAEPGASFDQTAMAYDLRRIANHVAATHAVGVSMGAASILRILTREPARFEAIALLLPAWLDGDAPDREANARLADTLETPAGAQAVEREVLASDAMRALVGREPRWEHVIREQIRRMNAPGLTHALRAYPSGDAPVANPALLKRVVAPALILAHDGDPGHPAEVARRLHELLPHARLHVAPEPLEMLDDMHACGLTISGFFDEEKHSLVSAQP